MPIDNEKKMDVEAIEPTAEKINNNTSMEDLICDNLTLTKESEDMSDTVSLLRQIQQASSNK